MNFKRIISIAFAATLAVSAIAQSGTPAYKDRNLKPEQRAADLIGRLTLEEKASLMQHHAAAVERLDINKYNWWSEALHGVARNGSATVYPQPIGMASSFDKYLLKEIFTAVSDEARVKNRIAAAAGEGVNIYEGVTFWTPNINIYRDPRWGRGMETYGEDPYLTGQLGMEVVRGLQGEITDGILKTHACAKHYAVHSGPESTRHSYDARVSERDLRETYLPAFKDLVTKAGVMEVMTAYNSFNGEPCAASGRLVQEILRGEWGYKGLVVSDCWAINDFYQKGHHEWVQTPAEAAAAAVKNGMDVECGEVFTHIPEAVALGLLTEEEVDACLFRQIVARYNLGEMDGVSPWDNLPEDIVEGTAHRALSRKMAEETIVLLQNKNNILPLAKGTKVALIGPNSNDAEMMWGNYNPVPKNTVTLLQAMQEQNPDIVSFRGCGIIDSKYMDQALKTNNRRGFDLQNLDMTDEEIEALAKRYAVNANDIKKMIQRQIRMRDNFLPALDVPSVLEQLEGIDVVVFAGGISSRLEGEEMPVQVPGFSGGDRTDIELPSVQRDLIKALHDAGKKVILVNFSGSAMGLVPETENCEAILQAWYPGQEGGYAITDILYGNVNPSAKLPLTFYKSVDQLPEFDNYDMADRTYRYFKGQPLFEFGYGLSYTKFKYGKAKVKNGVVTVKIKNKGKREGTEVVQLYVSRPADVEGPVKTLRGFQRVTIPAGKSVKVSFELTDETFEWWNPEVENMTPLHGTYKLMCGTSSAKGKTVTYKY